VADRHRDTHRGDADAQVGEVEDAADLLDDLDLLSVSSPYIFQPPGMTLPWRTWG